jgi:hypothetical protein
MSRISKRYVKIMIAAAMIMLVSFLLVTGSPILEYNLIENPQIPLGNILTWLGLMSWTLFFIWIIPSPGKFINVILGAAFALSLFWPLVGYLLSGNLRNEFYGNDGLAKLMVYSGIVVMLPLMTASLSLSMALLKKIHSRKLN